jgi:DNA polymerase-3 subunit delta|tara:strand:+ start:1393 stop:2409 length:1017 start_codon:yes stop_codon:yes gene_type:complete
LLYVLYGEDDYSIHQKLEELKKEIGDSTALVTNMTVFDGAQVTVDQLKAVSEAMPFLAEKRLVIVYGLLGRFAPKGQSGQRKKSTRVSRPPEGYRALGEYLGQTLETTILVLVDGRLRGKNLLLQELAGKARVMSFPLPREARLLSWIQDQVREKGSSISPQAIGLLVRFVGSNLWIMSNEIEKLVLFTSGRRVEEADVRQVVSYAQEANVFTMVDAILEFRVGVAGQLLQQLLQQGASPAYLLVMLTRQVRLVVRVKELTRQKKPLKEMLARLELASEYVLQKTLVQAGRYSLARLKEVYHKLLEVDLSIKTGRYDAELALNMLVAELCQKDKLGIV